MVPAEGVRLLELACLQEALGPLLGCPCCAGQLQLREDCGQSSGLYSALCFACQACPHRLPLHTSCRASAGSGWQVNISTQQAKAQLGVGDDLLCRLFNIYRIPYHPQSDIPDSGIDESIQSTEALLGGSIDTCRTSAILDSLLERDEPFRDFVCSLCHQSFDCLRMLKQHVNLHNMECIDNVNLMNSLERSIDNRDDLLHVPIESLEPDTGLVFSSTDVEKSLQLSPKTQTVSRSLCDQRFQTLDILEENLDTDSIHGTFEYSENFDNSTSNLTDSLTSEKEEIMECPVESNVSTNLKILKPPLKDNSSQVHSNSTFDQALSISSDNEHKCSSLLGNSLKENQKDLKMDTVHSPIEAIVIETVLQFPAEDTDNQLDKNDHVIPTDNSSITLTGLEVLKNQTRTSSFTFLEQNSIETITSSIGNTNNIKGPTSAKIKSKSHSDVVDNIPYNNLSVNSLSCTICDHVFENIDSLKKHSLQHCSSKQFKCSQCSLSFDAKHELNVHCTTSHVKNKYLCTVCGKSYKKSSSLTQHSRKHTGEKLLCSTCGKSFNDASTFNKHQKTVHSAERTLKCETCGKTFYHSGHLKVHMRLHTGEKPYVCSLCGKRYAYADSITKHMKFHLDKKEFTCTKCSRSFRWKESLKQHMKTHQKDNTSCDEAWLIQCREPVVSNDQRTQNTLSIDVTDSDANLNQEISFLDSLAVKYF